MSSIRSVFGLLWRTVDGVRKVLHLILLLVLFAIVLAALSPRIPLVPARAALVVAPQGALVEQLSDDPFERAIAEAYGQQRAETLVRDVVEAIDAARDDDRIVALVLDPKDMYAGGLVKLEEIGRAVERFRESGKPVIAMADYYDQTRYLFAAQADEIYLDPQGMVLLDGYGYYRMFLKQAIDKLAVDVHVFKAGRYKSYTDQFSREAMSEEERTESRAWLDALWKSYQSAVESVRKLQPGSVSAYVEHLVDDMRGNGGDMAEVALERGLVTEIKPRADVNGRLAALTGDGDKPGTFRGVSHWDYLAAIHSQKALTPHGAPSVSVVVASGLIQDGEQPPGSIGGDSTAALLREVREDDSVHAVVLRIDSPGGSVFASELIRREVDALKRAGKPVVASMSSVAASGGYYIAMDADEIWANDATLTGSIGVFAVFPTFERTLGKLGVSVDGLGTTSLSGEFRPDRTLGDTAANLLQLRVEADYRSFVEHVAQARGMAFEDADAIAQGRVWAGVDARASGLVDRIGGIEDAIEAAATRAGIAEDYDVTYAELPRTWRQALALQLRSLAARGVHALAPELPPAASLMRRLSPLAAELDRLAVLSDPRGAYYYCPCTVD
jgi:protease IV